MELNSQDNKGRSSRDDIHQFRPPLVTATGIFLGFMLNFTNEWLPHSFSRSTAGGIIVAVSVTSSIGLLIVVLYRILKKDYPVDRVDTFYRTTLRLFIIGIIIPFFTILLAMIARLVDKIFYGGT
jgi:hypothetical protein